LLNHRQGLIIVAFRLGASLGVTWTLRNRSRGIPPTDLQPLDCALEPDARTAF
jgi:hypothetical protein